jgi:hypothetical protein
VSEPTEPPVAAEALGDDLLRQRQLELFFEEADARVEGIQAAMHDAGWETGRASFSVLAAIPGCPQLFGLAAAVWAAFAGGQRQVPQDLAYAAYARAEL